MTSLNLLAPAAAVETLAGLAAGLVARLRQAYAAAETQAMLEELTPDQLHDLGIDPAAALPPRPVLTVERGLMARLESLR